MQMVRDTEQKFKKTRRKEAAANELFEAQECDEKITINETYAKKFEERKNKEELQRLSKLQKEASENFSDSEKSTESSEREEEDSDAELVTKEVGAKVLETISRISLKKREIYDPKRSFFDEEDFIQDESEKKASDESLTVSKFICSTLKKVSGCWKGC